MRFANLKEITVYLSGRPADLKEVIVYLSGRSDQNVTILKIQVYVGRYLCRSDKI